MTELVLAIAALVTAVGSVLGAIFGYKKTLAVMEQKVEYIEQRLEEYKGLNEKLEKISISIARIETDINYLKDKR